MTNSDNKGFVDDEPSTQNGKVVPEEKNIAKRWKEKIKKDDKVEGDDKEPEEIAKPDPVPIKELFRFASTKDITLMIIGLGAAIIAGLCFPAMVILFGRLTNAFVYDQLNVTNVTGFFLNHPEYENMTKEEILEDFGILDLQHEINIFGIYVSVIGVIQLVFGYIFVTSFNYAAECQAYKIRGTFLRSILRQEIGYFDTHKSNDFASRATEDINKIQDGLGEKIGMFLFFMTTFIGSMINAFYHGWQLTLVILSVFPVLIISAGLMAKIQTSLTAKELEEYAKAGSIAEEVFSSVRTVLSFGGEEKEVDRYEKNLEDAKKAGIKRGLMTGISVGSMWFVIFSAYSLAFWYGTKLILDSREGDGNYTPSDLIIVFFSVLIGAMNVGQSAPYVEAFNVGRGAAATIYKVIDRTSEIDPLDDRGERPGTVIGTIEFNSVHFQYPSRPEAKILQGLDLLINPGKTVALVGSSGCGKSTCIQLVQRFYDPAEGSVTLDGKDIRELNIGWLRNNIGIVGQEPVLFATTIAENIRHGKEKASMDEIHQAAKEANAHEFIMKLPKKYETQVGERGVQISGGQKQRIAIARALIKKPRILLLDEATSALDNQSEAIVQRALDKVSVGRTTIIVAHRLTTIRQADLIIVMDEGQIVEKGTHAELMDKKGLYKTLVMAQLTPSQAERAERGIYTDETDDEDEDDKVYPSHKKLNRNTSIMSETSITSYKSSHKDKHEEESSQDISSLDILKMNSPEWYLIALGTLGAAIQGCIMPGFAILFGNVLGSLAEEDPDTARDMANKYSLLFFILGIISAVSMFTMSYMFALAGEKLTMRLRLKAFLTILRQEMGWFDEDENSVGALCSRLSSDAAAVQGATGSRIGTIVQSIVTLSFGIILAMIYNARLGAVTLPFIPLIFLSVYVQMKIIMGQSITESKVLEDASKKAVEAIGNIRTVASLHKEHLFAVAYEEALREPHMDALRKSHVRGLAFGFAQSVVFFAYAVVMFYGGHLVEKGVMEFEEVFKVAEAMILGTATIGQAVAFAPNYGKAKVSASKLSYLFNRIPKIDSSPDRGIKMTQELSSVQLKDVHFSYPTRPTQAILRGMDVDMTKGQIVALVGSSGCGKSTIINLLERFYSVDSGTVALNDTNIESLNVGYARTLFGLVSQEPVLFDRTISENIAYGDNLRSFSQNDIELVAKQANIHSFIQNLPDGYNTRVGSKGTQLSGGQKQRVAIARALIRNPEVLLLDEATSALDAESELIVQETLEQVQRGRTTIVIAHRLSTIRGAHKILVVNKGKVIESGTHEQLLELNGFYNNLYKTNVRR